MLTLLHHPFCPHSRFVRLALEEMSLVPRLVEERTWERRTEFLKLNAAGTTPVLLEEGMPPAPGAALIAEYLDETRGGKLPRRLLPPEPGPRLWQHGPLPVSTAVRGRLPAGSRPGVDGRSIR